MHHFTITTNGRFSNPVFGKEDTTVAWVRSGGTTLSGNTFSQDAGIYIANLDVNLKIFEVLI